MLKAPQDLDAINIWWVNLDELPLVTDQLTPAEQMQFARIKSPQHHQRMVNARASLRQALSFYVTGNPLQIEFTPGQHGKPYCKNEPRLFFNISHAGSYAVIAINYDDEIGVDIETTQRRLSDLPKLAERVFTADELAWLQTQPEQEVAFLTLWTRKEAVIKASGEGLGAPLTTIGTTQANGTIIHPIPYLANNKLVLQDLTAPASYQAAIVYRATKPSCVLK